MAPRVTLRRLLPHARGLGFKPRRGGFPSGAKKEWGLSPKENVRVLHTAQLDVTCEGLGTPTEPHHTPSLEAQQSPHTAPSSPSQPIETTKTILTSSPTAIPTLRQYSRRARIAQSIALLTAQIEMASKINAQDLEMSNLKARIKFLEDKDGGGAEPSGEDATIKGGSLETGEEAGVEKSTKSGSNDTEELINVLTSMDAANKEKMVEPDTPKKKLQEQIDVQVAREMEEQMAKEDQRRNEQITRDAEIARIHAEEELQMLIDGLDRNIK
nr:hypothetical protein [Tanacetum cinerariifolium]